VLYKKYYTPFEEQPVRKEYPAEVIKPKKAEPEQQIKEAEKPGKKPQQRGFFGNVATDDIILIGILLLLLMEDKKNRDMPLILGIGFLLLIEYLDNE
jgi:hypothetical protein